MLQTGSVLILGSQGFIGSNLAAHFVSKRYAVTGCDLVEFSTAKYEYHKLSVLAADFDELFAAKQFSFCINAAGSGNVGYSVQHPFSDFEANTYVVAKVLDSIRKYQPACKYVHISSAAVYGNPVSLPVKEDTKPAPLSPYGFNKLMSEQLCTEYHLLYHIPVAVVRPFSVYGNGLKKQLIWDICSRLTMADTIELFGTGNESRDFIHVDDLALLIGLIIEQDNFSNNIYNAASGTETSVKTIAAIFEKHFAAGKQILFSKKIKTGDPVNWQADMTKAQSIGFTNQRPLEASLIDYIKWFKTTTGEQ